MTALRASVEVRRPAEGDPTTVVVAAHVPERALVPALPSAHAEVRALEKLSLPAVPGRTAGIINRRRTGPQDVTSGGLVLWRPRARRDENSLERAASLRRPRPRYVGAMVDSDAHVALAAAAAGAAVVRAAYGGELVKYAKSDLDFATQVDIDAERAILDVLAHARPDDARVGEESGCHDGAGSRRWLIDPLCGTLNFAAQTPLLSVNVALVDGEVTLACASADPLADEVFWSDGSFGSVRSRGLDCRLHPSSLSRLVDVNCDGPLDRRFVGGQLVADPEFRASFGPRVLSTTLALAWTAAGRRAGYVTDGSSLGDNVHFAAGIALCIAAGCVVTDLCGNPINKGRGLIAAADPETHARLVELVRPHLDGTKV